MSKVKVVLDTNVYISAILFGGKSELLINLGRERAIHLFISDLILNELIMIFKTKFNWNNEQIYFLMKTLHKITYFVVPTERIKVITAHKFDNHILECAIEAKANYIVSGDKHHILPLKNYHGIEILSVSQFLNKIEARSSGLF
jgi:putative PIN family toxin of toxin-antitoxin system